MVVKKYTAAGACKEFPTGKVAVVLTTSWKWKEKWWRRNKQKKRKQYRHKGKVGNERSPPASARGTRGHVSNYIF